MRVSVALGASLLIFLSFLACGSSSTTGAEPTGVDAGGDGASPGAADLATLGQSCAGACSPGKVCTFNDKACAPGLCAVDVREGIRTYCSLDCSATPCPAGFDCVTSLTQQRVCVAPGKPTCGDHIVDDGEGCDNGGTAPLECTAACKVAPATLRATRMHAVLTNGPDSPGVFESNAPQARVTLPYVAPWNEVPRDLRVAGVSYADVTTQGDGIHVQVDLNLPNRDISGMRTSEPSGIDVNLKREGGHFEAKNVLVPEDESLTICTSEGAFDVQISGKRTYAVTFKYTRKCVLKAYGTLFSDESIEGALEFVAPQ